MTRTQNNVSPQIAQRLAEMARELRTTLYGEAGCPEWGTKFNDIEEQGMNIGLEIGRLIMEQTVEEQASGTVPPESLESDDETAGLLGTERETRLETPAGEISWQQPQARLDKTRRDFFPSGPSVGRGC